METPDIDFSVTAKTFSLGSAAGFLGVSKGTVRTAIERGELPATKNAQNHYTIKGVDVLQYQARREEDSAKQYSTISKTGIMNESNEPVHTGVQPAGVDLDAILASHKIVVRVLEGTIEDLKEDRNAWRSQNLLTDQRPVKRVGRYWLLALALLCLVGAVAGYNYLDIPVTW